MQIKNIYLQRCYHMVAEEQIAEEYRKKGYKVSKEYHLGEYIADLFVENDTEKIVIEVKTGNLSKNRLKKLGNLADYVRTLGDYKFRIAVVTPPKNREISVEGIEDILMDEMNRNLPNEIDELSNKSYIKKVYNIDIENISVKDNKLHCIGCGMLEVGLKFDSEIKDNNDSVYVGPFSFDILLETGISLKYDISVNYIKVNISDY